MAARRDGGTRRDVALTPVRTRNEDPMSRRHVLVGLLLLTIMAPPSVLAAPEGEMSWALHFSLAPTLFEPAETPGVVSPFMIFYALHDAMVKPMPGKSMAPSLA